jgi:nitrite reductase/ring-hydroxylating ferredoxin subunit
MHGYVFDLPTGHLLAPRGLCEHQRRFLARFEGDEVVVSDPGAGAAILGI